MKKASLLSISIVSIIFLSFSFSQFSCTQSAQEKTDSLSAPKQMSQSEMIARGKYLVLSVGCEDCHCPKIMTPQGPFPDTTKFLSGHPAGRKLPAIDKNTLKPGNWYLLSDDLTAAVGPWGISFAANLTPDSATGIGTWTEDVFIKTLRTGKHLGQDGGRRMLPPMPWQDFTNFNDEDLKAIFAFLKALPPIVNKVPSPVIPPDVLKMN